ncbi:MAG: ubiquinone/menaquinone biosynthesis methyltransferase [Dehalococcoidia bacterium]|nr:ubiquinone/menaquinone biosynthesis methyltransferase [Dehalococcoidia bacterium]
MTALPAPEEKAAAVQRMFDRIAPRYDRMNRIMTGRMDQRWRRSLVERLGIDDEDRVLDLACGTGDFAEIAREHTRHVIGLDFARGMLHGARARDLGAVELVQADALRLPLRDGSITVAVSGFALRNFVALPPVFAELARVLAPGGRIGLLEVDRPDRGVVRLGHHVYFDRVVPFVGGILSDRSAYRYLPQSAVYLPDKHELARMLRDAGFRDIRKRRHAMGAAQSITAVRA